MPRPTPFVPIRWPSPKVKPTARSPGYSSTPDESPPPTPRHSQCLFDLEKSSVQEPPTQPLSRRLDRDPWSNSSETNRTGNPVRWSPSSPSAPHWRQAGQSWDRRTSRQSGPMKTMPTGLHLALRTPLPALAPFGSAPARKHGPPPPLPSRAAHPAPDFAPRLPQPARIPARPQELDARHPRPPASPGTVSLRPPGPISPELSVRTAEPVLSRAALLQ